MLTVPLASLEPGQSARIVALSCESELGKRLYALGFREGRKIHLLRRGWMAGPLHVQICMTEVMVRRRDARNVHICPIHE
jgi:Fe2+ transport system protein FeoA